MREALEQHGFVFLRGHAPDLETVAACALLGEVLRADGFEKRQLLKPRTRTGTTPNTYSGNYGLEAFPLHTDLAHWPVPPRYLALRCIEGRVGVTTRLLDGRGVVAELGELRLRRALVQPRRPLDGARPLLRLLDLPAADGFRLRWDNLFLVPATSASAETYAALRTHVAGANPTELALVERGDTLIVDNWRMVHGRSAVAPDAVGRHLERVYLGGIH